MTYSGLKAQAWAAVPGFEAMSAAIDELKARAAAVRVDGPSEAAAQRAMFDAVAAGGPTPDAPEVDVLAARAAEVAATVRETCFVMCAHHVGSMRDAAVLENHAKCFDVLADEVASISAELRSLGVIPLSADSAVRSDAVEVFRAAQGLVDRYTVVRAVFADLWKLTGTNAGHQQTLCWMRPEALMEFDPATRELLTGGEFGSREPPTFDTWPGYVHGRDTGAWPVEDADRLAWLVWAATHDALWAPTPAQVVAGRAEVSSAVSAAIGAVAEGKPTPRADSERARLRRAAVRL